MADNVPKNHHPDKKLGEHCEDVQDTEAQALSSSSDATRALSQAHRESLMQRHGTLDLDPIPDPRDADPYNWPQWKKLANLTLVAIHASMATFIAAAIIPAFASLAEDLGVSLQQVSYLTTIQIAILAVAPLIHRPFANTYGRRPLFLLSLVGSLIGNIGCAKSPSYATMAVCRAIVAFFISPAAAIGSGVVTETFLKKHRARYMGIWTLMTILGVPIAPLIMGFVAAAGGYRWIYWTLAIINAVQLIAYSFLGPETRYIRPSTESASSTFKQEYLSFGRIDPRPLKLRDIPHPLGLWRKVCVVIPAIAHTITFGFANTLIAVEIPQLFGAKFGMSSQQLGLQFLGIIVGSVIGEQVGGSFSDYWMNRRSRKTGQKSPPEFRLWISYVGFILAIVGMVVFLVQTERAPEGQWNITPVIGIAIAGAGNQIVTTILITYAVDCHPEDSASIGVFVTFIRQLWAFIGPFWFPPMFTSVGVAASSGVAAALIAAVGFLPILFVQWQGSRWRGERNKNAVNGDDSGDSPLQEKTQ